MLLHTPCCCSPCLRAAILAGTRQNCKRYALHHCGHEDTLTAAECLASQIRAGNGDHFFVATQDKSLQRRINELPGGAVIFASVNGIHLEQPSAAQKEHVQRADREALMPGAVERHSAALKELDGEERSERGTGGRGIFRRNIAKGPNPLSRKPKKTRTDAGPAAGGEAGGGGGSGDDSKGEKRRRQRRKREAGDDGGET